MDHTDRLGGLKSSAHVHTLNRLISHHLSETMRDHKAWMQLCPSRTCLQGSSLFWGLDQPCFNRGLVLSNHLLRHVRPQNYCGYM